MEVVVMFGFCCLYPLFFGALPMYLFLNFRIVKTDRGQAGEQIRLSRKQ
jgi:hypothetical protein